MIPHEKNKTTEAKDYEKVLNVLSLNRDKKDKPKID